MPFKDAQAKKDWQASYRNVESNKDRQKQAISRKWDRYFGWTPGTHWKLLKSTPTCELCGGTFGENRGLSPATDHDHETGKFRGIIHGMCNTAIGLLLDDETKCLQAAAYLRKCHSESKS